MTSSIHSHLSALTSLDALERQRVDGLQGQPHADAGRTGDATQIDSLRTDAPVAPSIDEGEAILDAPAWTTDTGNRQLGHSALGFSLSGMERAQAMEHGVAAIVAGL